MRGTGKESQVRRELLRRRLMQLFDRAVAGAASIEAQIDDLLAEILHDDLSPQPLHARIDSRDEDDRIVVTGMGVVTPLAVSYTHLTLPTNREV